MRPYLAIIKDSFREAFATRILWMTLAAITLFLVLLLPITFDKALATQFQPPEVVNGIGLLKSMQDADTQGKETPAAHLWGLIPESQQEQLINTFEDTESNGPRDSRRRNQRALRVLNELIKRSDFYNTNAWKDAAPDADLIRTDLQGDELASNNRRLLAATFPKFIKLRSNEAIYANYLWLRLDFPLPFSPEELQEVIKRVVAGLTLLLLGMLGVLISILVTASMIPRTFEAGEITLLLSKPVSRSFLFLAKFAGGCAFTLVNVAYLLCGLWLIVGVKFEVWNHKLLLCIPVYLFLFSIYYSVAAWAGAIWRNAIIAVCITIAFWFFLFTLNVTKESLENLYVTPRTITEIIPAGDDLVAVNGSRTVLLWDQERQNWREIFGSSGDGPPAFARRFAFADSRFVPRYDAEHERLVALEPVFGRFGSAGSTRIIAGERSEDWTRETAGDVPDVVYDLFVLNGEILTVGRSGIYHFTPPKASDLEAKEWISSALGGLWEPQLANSVQELQPDDFQECSRNDSFAMHPVDGSLAIYRDGALQMLIRTDEGTYLSVEERNLETDEQAVLALGKSLAVCFENGSGFIVGAQEQELDIFSGDPPRVSAVSPQGRWLGFLSHTGKVWIYDAQNKKPASLTIPNQGDISAIQFADEESVWLADRIDRVRRVKLATGEVQETHAAPSDVTGIIYHWVVMPLYTLLPKPSRLADVVNYLMTEESVQVVTNDEFGETNLQQERKTVDVWGALVSNLAFLVFMLTCSCWHISRKDF